jgi:hypothetical protein
LVDDAAAAAIAWCMTEACFNANRAENEETTDPTRNQAMEMLEALRRAIRINRYGAVVALSLLCNALEGILADFDEEEETEEEERFGAIEESICEATVAGIIKRQGGFREKDILGRPHYLRRGTWNEEHKVVEIITKEADEYGYRDGCAVDIVTRRIVG